MACLGESALGCGKHCLRPESVDHMAAANTACGHALFPASSTTEGEGDDGALFAASSSEDTACPTTVASSNKRGSLKRSLPSCWADVGKATAAQDLFHKPCIVSMRAWARSAEVDKRWLGDLGFVGASHALRASVPEDAVT